jgi:hypothetical protein
MFARRAARSLKAVRPAGRGCFITCGHSPARLAAKWSENGEEKPGPARPG